MVYVKQIGITTAISGSSDFYTHVVGCVKIDLIDWACKMVHMYSEVLEALRCVYLSQNSQTDRELSFIPLKRDFKHLSL